MTAWDALARAIDFYYERGWRLIPVIVDPQTGSKRPATSGTTGAGGSWLSAAEVKRGLSHHQGTWAGIGIRPEPGVVGIDVDDYGGRQGGRTIRDLSADAEVIGWTGLGPLPASWRSTARPDRVSGIYWYRYDPDRWRPVRDVGPNVELIRWDHRFGAASPTYHPNGRPYRWYDPGSRTCEPPRITDLEWLPDAWVAHISAPHPATPHREGGSIVSELYDAGGWVRELIVESLSSAATVMEATQEGSRNMTLFRLAKDLGAAGLDLTDLRAAAIRSGLTPQEVAATIRSATAP